MLCANLEAQLPPKVVDRRAVLPQPRLWLARFPRFQLAQHPGCRILQKARNVTVGCAPRHADREAALVDRQDGASPLGTALQQEIHLAITETDGPGLGNETRLVEQSQLLCHAGSRATSLSIQSSTLLF